MKIEEAVNAINNSSDNIVVAKVMDNDVIEFKRSGSDSPFLRVPINAIAWCFVYEDWNYLYDIKATDLARVMDVIQQLLDTPIKERFPEKKYRVRLKCFNSDNGHQYLTMEKKLGSGKVFACALRSGVKQEFTPTELNEISNRPQFKSVPWFQEMVKAGIEPVEGK